MKKIICLMLIVVLSLSCCGCEFNPLKLIFDGFGQVEKVDDEIIEPIMPNPDYVLKRETMYGKTPKGYEKNNAREYTYNKDGYLAGVIVTNFGSTDIENEGSYNDYDANGNPKSLTFEGNDYTLYDYNDDGTMKEKTVYEDGSIVLAQKYEYDEYGKKIKCIAVSFGNESSMDNLIYKYESDKIVYEYIEGEDIPVTKIVSEYDDKNNKVKDMLYTRTDDEKELSEGGYIVYEYILKADVIAEAKEIEEKETPVYKPEDEPEDEPEDFDYDESANIQSEYYNKAEEIEIYAQNNLDTAATQTDINLESMIVFEKWDVLLNEVYRHLKSVMPDSEFKQLEADEIKWIKEKEAAIANAVAPVKGGTAEPMARYGTGIEYTRDRCYYLISLITDY